MIILPQKGELSFDILSIVKLGFIELGFAEFNRVSPSAKLSALG